MDILRVACISDTHGSHEELAIPDADILIHAGDLSRMGRVREIEEFARWFEMQPCTHKVLIAGNHDFLFEREPVKAREALGETIVYLQDTSVTLCGLHLYGSPWQPTFFNWAFNLPRGQKLRDVWAKIPTCADIVITHGPASGVLDRIYDGTRVGCEDLEVALRRVSPALHVFGHIHESAGWVRTSSGVAVNASACASGARDKVAVTCVDIVRDASGRAVGVDVVV